MDGLTDMEIRLFLEELLILNFLLQTSFALCASQ